MEQKITKEENRKKYLAQKSREYYAKNKEQVRERLNRYKQENKETIYLKMKEKTDCECGGKFTNRHKAKHLKSAKHQKYLSNLNAV